MNSSRTGCPEYARAIALILTCGCVLPFLHLACAPARKPQPGRPLTEDAALFAPDSTALRRVLNPLTLAPVLAEAFENRRDEEFEGALETLARYLLESDQSQTGAEIVPPALLHSSVQHFAEVLREAPDADAFVDRVLTEFNVYEAVGESGDGRVFFTGYFTPEYHARRERDERFQYPLYLLPEEFVTSADKDSPSIPTRREIEENQLLQGDELAWLDNALDVYLIHVNGSARLRFPDGSTMCVGLGGTNRREYTSLGRLMIERGLSTEVEMSMQKIRAVFNEQPTLIRSLMLMNDRYVFFHEADCAGWPRSALGVSLTPMHAIATDKSLFPAGALALVEFNAGPDDDLSAASTSRVTQFVIDCDTGGAIRGPGRADFYFGIGNEPAGQLAGPTKSHGRLLYLIKRE